MKDYLKDCAWLKTLPYFSIVGVLALLGAHAFLSPPASSALPKLLTEILLFLVLGVALMRKSKNAFPVFLMGLVRSLNQMLMWNYAGTASLKVKLWLLLGLEFAMTLVCVTNYQISGDRV